MRLISNAMSYLGYDHTDSREINAYWDLRRDS